jgi:hypothetical protein
MDVVQEGPLVDEPMDEDDVLLEVPFAIIDETSAKVHDRQTWL